MKEDKLYISAGDIEKFGYCPLSWWYSLKYGEDDPEALSQGSEDHEKIGNAIQDIKIKEEVGKRSERTVLWFAVIASLIAIVGVTFLPEFSLQILLSRILGIVSLIWLLAAAFFLFKSETVAVAPDRLSYTRLIVIFAMISVIISIYAVTFFLESDKTLSQVLEWMALFWLIGASFFLYRSLNSIHIANLKRLDMSIGTGTVEYVDLEKHKPKMLVSEKYGLRGRPDYILFKEGDHVAVEVKTGRTPQGPLFSHILQIGAYMILLEETYHQTPSHGILRYNELEHEIEYTPELKKLVLSKIEEMRKSLQNKDVHRNHNRPGKCRHCSRRGMCEEKLA